MYDTILGGEIQEAHRPLLPPPGASGDEEGQTASRPTSTPGRVAPMGGMVVGEGLQGDPTLGLMSVSGIGTQPSYHCHCLTPPALG